MFHNNVFLLNECNLQYTELGPMKDPKVTGKIILFQEPSFPSGSKPVNERERIKKGGTWAFNQYTG